jgi:hypothetical protein
MWLVNLEIPIVSTSLVGITDDLGGFSKSSWIVESYMLTYVGNFSLNSRYRSIRLTSNGFPHYLGEAQ